MMKQAGTQLENKKEVQRQDNKSSCGKKRVNPNYLAVVFMSATPTIGAVMV
jgi:hypothetical protein